jgi:hypothetical protein
VVLFLGNALPVLLPGHRSLADRVAGTTVTGIEWGRLGEGLRPGRFRRPPSRVGEW